jgi:capsular polysaccharide transport system ATP-binding protein
MFLRAPVMLQTRKDPWARGLRVPRIRRQQIHPRLAYVEDHARTLLAVVQRGRLGETYVIGGDAEARNIDIVQRICAILDARRPDAAPHARPAAEWRALSRPRPALSPPLPSRPPLTAAAGGSIPSGGMIEFRNVAKAYATHGRPKVILDGLTLTLPAGAKIGVLGRNGAGKSTLLGMISGTVKPDHGEIRRHASISWPLGFSGSFAGDLTGAQNIRFVARIYGIDTDTLVAYVEDFAELGEFIDMPVRNYSSGMKARLAFGMSMGVSFDWYLVDEITAVGDAAFRRKSLSVFKHRLRDAGLLMVSHSIPTIRSYCTSGLVLEDGRAVYYPDIRAAVAAHERNMSH